MTISHYSEARTFLQTLYSVYSRNHEGLTEIRLTSASAVSIFFSKAELSEADWARIVELNKTHQAYFGVNPRPRNQAKKQDDIKDIICLWADVDGKDFDGGKEEALGRVDHFPLTPSIVVDSGHGYHAYWVLQEPLINLSGDRRLAFKRILAGLIKLIAGDKSKVNLDALLRLPGTFNLKDDPPKECRVIGFNDRKYQLEDFALIKDEAYTEPEPSSRDLPSFGSKTASISRKDETSARTDVEHLDIPDKAKRLIITGEKLQGPGADHSRSARDFSIICSLIRGGYDYTTIKSIFYNPHLGCSDRFRTKPEKALQWDVLQALRKGQREYSETASPSPTPEAGERLQVRCAANIEPETTRWLWRDRFALGKLSLIVGDPESGKSLFTTWMAGKVSSGEAWPDETVPPKGKVVFLQCEDDVAETVRPRLAQYGADLLRVHIIDGVVMANGEDRMLSLLTDLKKLEDFLRTERDIKMIIIDPLQAYIGAGLSNKVNPHADAHIRAVLTPVKALAEAYHVAIIGVVHLNKNSMADMMYRVGGSIALVGLPRSVWLLKWDRDPNGFRYFQSMKSNRRAGVKGLAFNIDRDTGDVAFRPDIEVPSAMDLMAPSTDRRPREEAKVFIRERLLTGSRDASDLLAEAEQEGINRATLFAAKKELGVRSTRYALSGRAGKWVWHLPSLGEKVPTEVKPEEKVATLREQKYGKPQAAGPPDSGALEEAGGSEKVEESPAGEYEPEGDEGVIAFPEKAEEPRPKRRRASQPSSPRHIGRARGQERTAASPAPRDPNVEADFKRKLALIKAKIEKVTEPSA